MTVSRWLLLLLTVPSLLCQHLYRESFDTFFVSRSVVMSPEMKVVRGDSPY